MPRDSSWTICAYLFQRMPSAEKRKQTASHPEAAPVTTGSPKPTAQKVTPPIASRHHNAKPDRPAAPAAPSTNSNTPVPALNRKDRFLKTLINCRRGRSASAAPHCATGCLDIGAGAPFWGQCEDECEQLARREGKPWRALTKTQTSCNDTHTACNCRTYQASDDDNFQYGFAECEFTANPDGGV